jgi:hypothetical protein
MTPMLKRTLSARWLRVGVHASLWLLLYLALVNLRGKAPDVRDAEAMAAPTESAAPVAGLTKLFSPAGWRSSLSATNLLNPFSTRYFIPPVPPPATTRTIEVTYQGFYETDGGPKQTIFKLGKDFMVAPIGTPIASNLFIADVTMQAMTLTNVAAQTNILPLNVKKELVVPIQ